MPAFPNWPTLSNITADANAQSLTKSGGGAAWNGYAATEAFPANALNMSIEGKITLGGWRLGFHTASTGGWKFCIEAYNGELTQIFDDGSREVISHYAVSDTLKVTVENTVARAYLNEIPIIPYGALFLNAGPYYARVEAYGVS